MSRRSILARIFAVVILFFAILLTFVASDYATIYFFGIEREHIWLGSAFGALFMVLYALAVRRFGADWDVFRGLEAWIEKRLKWFA